MITYVQGVNTNKCESLHNSTTIRARGEVDAVFAALQQASEGSGEVDGDQ
jgi:hypothetical protein